MSSSLKKIVNSTLLLTVGQGSAQMLSLIRNAIFGHYLSPEDFGVAATFAITISAVEMASDMGADKLLIQAKDGDNIVLQNTIHSFNFIRGLVSAIIIVFMVPYLIDSFNIKTASWAFYLLAFVVFIRGFVHLDVKRFHREMKFLPFVLTELIPQVVVVLLSYPLVLHFKNYDAVIYLILLHALFYVLMSHVLSKRSYQISFDSTYFKKILTFGWPLILNGILMYFIFQGDKLFVGINYDLSTLGVYSAAFMITMVPALLVVKIFTSILLPLFSKSQDDWYKSNNNYLLATEVVMLIALLFAAIFIFFGDTILAVVFGSQYQGNGLLIAILSIMWAFRIIRVAPALLAMSKGDTKVSLMANILRSFALVGVYLLTINKYPIEMIAFCGCAGELLAFLLSIVQLKYKIKVQYTSVFIRFILYCFFILSFIAPAYYLDIEYKVIFYTSLFLFVFSLYIRFSRVAKVIKCSFFMNKEGVATLE